MTITKQIINCLKEKDLTSLEIANNLSADINQIYVYLNRLVKNETIVRKTDTKPYLYGIERSGNLDLLRSLYEILIKMKSKEKINEIDLKTIETIEKVLGID